MKTTTQYKCMIGWGASLVVVFAVLMGAFQPIYDSIVDGALTLKDGKAIMDSFTTPPVPIYLNFYLFNVTNPDQVKFYGEIPELVEFGPYVYEEMRLKYEKTFHSDGETISYLNNKTYFFREDLSNGLKESDKLTTVNVVMALVAAMGYEVKLLSWIWPEIENKMDIFEEHTISEWLFNGWELPIFNFNFSQSGIPGLSDIEFEGTLPQLLEHFGKEVPEALAENRIGYYSMMNNTNDGKYLVNTGKNNMDEYIYVQEWNDKEELTWWGEEYPYCNMINGTDGTQFPPRSIDESTTVRIFVTELCRSLYLEYEYTMDYRGIKALRFVAPDEMMAAPSVNPANECFCAHGTLGCLGSSLMEMTPCLGVPLVMSTPHFYQGDGEELSKFKGLQPVKEDHETLLDLETTFGVPVRAHKRIQLNVPLMPYGSLTSFMNFNQMMFPVLWADEVAELSQEDADTMNKALKLPFTLMYSIGGVLLSLGLLILLVGVHKRYQHRKRQTV